MLNRTITWHHCLTIDLIASPFHIFTPDTEVDSALRVMKQYNWDIAGYSESGSGNADAIVRRSSLEKPDCTSLKRASENLDIGLLVAEQTPILDALSRIVENERLYVFGKGGVNRLVTLADLNKQQVRLLIFGLISSLEVRLLQWIKRHDVTSGNLSQWLSQERVEKAERILRLRKEKNEDTDLLDCLMFIDKASLIQKLKISSLLDPHGRKKWDDFFDRMQRVRDDIAHAHDPSERVTWPNIVQILDLVESMMAVSLPSEQ